MSSLSDAISRGITPLPTAHKKQRRARWHNYSLPGFYMLTIVVDGRHPLLGTLYTSPSPHVVLSPLGQAIVDGEVGKMHHYYPNVTVHKVAMMPDHIHIIVEVTQSFPKGKHLGNVVGGFKGGCTRAWRALGGNAEASLFEEGYNDNVLVEGEVYQRWVRYLDNNPRRLAIKRARPDLFRSLCGVDVAGRRCQAFGNVFLLDIPDKMSVVVHHDDSDAEFQHKFQQWMACGERGGILVGASIAPREKQVMRAALDRDYRLIHLVENGFPALYKPPGDLFDACADGRLLQITPWQYHFDRRTITRAQCLELNALGVAIAAMGGR